ncbi:hypothetical protein D7V97_08635 [Corallococcus sp. CA053C]|uniref:hypothetical protein n=1 Tax=Corallococcus sp. CA053C TaxID=2316732 RepID=UPI000EA2A6E5|nr:hypothetical protein [Corallococcus sp. CA053C]RKH12375.1 hypothetical protein D7V97_08635 [Corallococcus sp. CA053C]
MALDLTEFQKTHVYRAQDSSVPAVLADLEVVEQLDQQAELTRRKLWIGAWVLLGCGIGSFILLPFLMDAHPDGAWDVYGPLVSGVGVLDLVAAVVLFVVRARRRRMDLDNRRYGLVATLLKRLQVDLDPDSPVSLTLDLAPNDDAHKRIQQDTRGRWQREVFKDAWLDLQARFADGTYLRLSMVEYLQKRSRTQRNARGKTKTKRKQKGKALMQVALRVKPEQYPGLADLTAPARSAARLPPGIKLSRIRVARDRLVMRALMAHDWVLLAPKAAPAKAPIDSPPPAAKGRGTRAPVGTALKQDASQTATMMLLSLYQVLNFSSSLRKRGDAKATP